MLLRVRWQQRHQESQSSLEYCTMVTSSSIIARGFIILVEVLEYYYSSIALHSNNSCWYKGATGDEVSIIFVFRHICKFVSFYIFHFPDVRCVTLSLPQTRISKNSTISYWWNYYRDTVSQF
jgi:hypothetical protein